MPDHRIGVSVDVRDNGGADRLNDTFTDLARTSKDLESNFAQANKVISQFVTDGLGSEKYTKNLRDQVRLIQQMNDMVERQTRLNQNEDSRQTMRNNQTRQSLSNASRPSGAGGVGGAVGAGGGTVNNPSSWMSTTGKWAGRAAMLAGGYVGLSAVRQGYSDARSQNFGLADISKTMSPGGGTEASAYGILGAGHGYAYSNQQILSGAQTIKDATGKNPDFLNQIHGVAQFGRQYGFDYNQAANYFAGSYQSGVTGGSKAQMSWQQYAILVANTVQQANMQGREGQVVSTLQQLTQQMSAQNMTAPNQQGMAGLYTTAAKTGNQSLINNYGSIMSAVNGGIQSPGMGAMGQAAMWQAVAPGQDYWGAQMQMSKGNTPENFQNMIKYAYSHFGGNSDQAAVILGQWLGVPPTQAQQLLTTYMKNGQFQTSSPSTTTPPKNQTPVMSSIDKTNQNFVSADQGKQGFGSDFLNLMGNASNFMFGTPTRAAATTATSVVGGALVKNAIKKKITQTLAQRTAQSAAGRAGTSAVGDVAGDSLLAGTAEAGGATLASILGLPLAGLGAMAWAGNTPAPTSAQNRMQMYSQRYNAYLKSHPNYTSNAYMSGGLGGLVNHTSIPNMDDPNAPWNKGLPHYAGGAFVNKPTVAVIGESGPEMVVPLRGGAANTRSSPQQDAQKVIATILALRPWKDTIINAFSNPSDKSVANGRTSNQPSVVSMGSDLTAQLKVGGGANMPSVNYSNPYATTPTNSYVGTGQKSFVQKMMPYAKKSAAALGIPSQYQQQFATFALAQWAHESDWGTSPASQQNDNFGGIKPPGSGHAAGINGTYAGYSSLNDWSSGYASFLKKNPNYSKVVSAGRSGASAEQLANLMADTPYAEDSKYRSGLMTRLGQVQSALKVQIDAPKAITINIADALGNILGSTLLNLTKKATMNGQRVSQPVGHAPVPR